MNNRATGYWFCSMIFVAGCHTSTERSDSKRTSAPGASTGTALPSAVLPSSSFGSSSPAASLNTPQGSETSSKAFTQAASEAHDDIRSVSVSKQQQHLIRVVAEQMQLSGERAAKVREIVEKSDWMSFGNPKVSKPAMTKAECRQRRAEAKWRDGDSECGAPNMVVVEREHGQPTTCIDQYEFPNVVCEYPVVWVRAAEAASLCEAVGKRLCDAHEWEGACAGDVLPVADEYPWDKMPKSIGHSPTRDQRLWLEYEHNRTREVRWAYGERVNHGLCGTGAKKDSKCDVVDFGTCSSSTYPAGSFPECVSPLGVYDQHGNAAEHMNLPLTPKELTGEGGSGWTEMKGSWFIFSNQETHPDDCRWRARSWHTTQIRERNSHRNYHLGFRCCADVD